MMTPMGGYGGEAWCWFGLSTDSKPAHVENSIVIEGDTADIYRSESGVWVKKINATYSASGHNHSGVYQPLDTQLTDLAGLGYSGNALKVLRVNVGENSFELATVGLGIGDLLAANNLSDVLSAATSFANIKQAASTTVTGVVELATDGESAANLVPQANDARLSNARTPTAHAASHADGGSDEVSVDASQITTGTIGHARLGTGGGGSTKFLREDSTFQTIAGGGDVVGPASATDNAVARYDSTTGKLLQNSAATVSDDGIIRSATNSGANAVAVPLTNWLMLTADYTLANSAAEQKAFNTTTNGRLTLPTGVYEFECFLYLTTMSATSGNFAFDPIGAGTAVTDRWGQAAYGFDNNSPLGSGARGGSSSVTQQSPAAVVTAGTGTGVVATCSGMFRISTGGTIIPSVTLGNAAAAVVKAGSWFRIAKVGESAETTVGAWD